MIAGTPVVDREGSIGIVTRDLDRKGTVWSDFCW